MQQRMVGARLECSPTANGHPVAKERRPGSATEGGSRGEAQEVLSHDEVGALSLIRTISREVTI